MDTYGQDKWWPFAEGGETTILLASSLAAGAVTLYQSRPNWGTRFLVFITAVLLGFILYFFRDPNREVRDEPGMVMSAGDGEVVMIVREREETYLHREVIRVSTFLAVTNVHVQRVPLGGKVTMVAHKSGQFLQAYRPEASQLNEHIAMIVDSAYGQVMVKQIAGIMARRCVSHARPGDQVTTGQRFGLIKFGSRVDIFLPATAQLLIHEGDIVAGGLTPIAQLTPPNNTS